MKWEKKGLVFGPDGSSPWARHTALQPTPLLVSPEVIRVYAGFRDDAGISRVGFVDLDADDPSRVLDVSDVPALDIGIPGAFDDNGVVPCAVVPREDGLYLYYAGYQIPSKVKFFVFGGLAVSRDGGRSFERHSRVPVLDRTEDEMFFRVAHSVLYEGGRWRVWYGGGSEWVEDGGKVLPVYDVRYLESEDGIHFGPKGRVCVPFEHPDEYRIGRPYVFREGSRYRMFYGTARLGVGYRMGYAESEDGIHWTRRDDEVGLGVSSSDWDSQMVAYPGVLACGERTYMFYNGSDMGRSGFGYAVLRSW